MEGESVRAFEAFTLSVKLTSSLRLLRLTVRGGVAKW